MNKVNDFDPVKYKELLERLGKCRRGIKSHTFYEGLSCIVPGGYISMDLENLLNKWCETNPSGSWGSCYKIAKDIRELLLGSK
jgi:hypothetical protein